MLSTASLVQLHSVNLTLNSVSLDGDEMSFDVNDDDGIVSIKSPMVFDVGKSLEITIKYEGIFHEDSGIMLKNISSGRLVGFKSGFLYVCYSQCNEAKNHRDHQTLVPTLKL